MRRIHYAGTSLSTGDRIATRLLSAIPIGTGYAVVTFPARLDGGEVGDVQLVLSAGTQILSVPGIEGDADAQATSLDEADLSEEHFEWFPSQAVAPVTAVAATFATDDEFDYDFEELF